MKFTLNLSYDALAQLAHVGWAGTLTLIVALWLPLWVALVFVPLAGAVKEFAIEPRIEDAETQGSAWRDFAFWCLGVGIAFIAVAARILL
ncbi:MAG: hypothetical protein ABSF92_01215 [Candidatus Acidiferrales bacterium]|jgi:hypothetical protein